MDAVGGYVAVKLQPSHFILMFLLTAVIDFYLFSDMGLNVANGPCYYRLHIALSATFLSAVFL